MTVHALVADPPRPGLALPALVEDGGLLAPDQAATLAAAMIRDAAVGVANSGGEFLVNHPTEAQLPAAARTGPEPAEELRELLDGAVDDPDAVRFEPQVGATRPERIEHTVGHLLEEAGADSVALLDGRAPTLDHTALDSAAMKLRRSAVVVGPAPAGQVTYLGLTEPVDFGNLSLPFSLTAVVDLAIEAGHDVDFLPMHPRVDDAAGLATLVSVIQARRAAGRRVPAHTAAAIDSLGLEVSDEDGVPRVAIGTTDRA